MATWKTGNVTIDAGDVRVVATADLGAGECARAEGTTPIGAKRKLASDIQRRALPHISMFEISSGTIFTRTPLGSFDDVNGYSWSAEEVATLIARGEWTVIDTVFTCD